MVGYVKRALYAMQRWTFWLDIKIVLPVLRIGLVGGNVY